MRGVHWPTNEIGTGIAAGLVAGLPDKRACCATRCPSWLRAETPPGPKMSNSDEVRKYEITKLFFRSINISEINDAENQILKKAILSTNYILIWNFSKFRELLSKFHDNMFENRRIWGEMIFLIIRNPTFLRDMCFKKSSSMLTKIC